MSLRSSASESDVPFVGFINDKIANEKCKGKGFNRLLATRIVTQFQLIPDSLIVYSDTKEGSPLKPTKEMRHMLKDKT